MRVRINDLFHTAGYGIWIMRDGPGITEVAKPMKIDFEKIPGDAFMLPEPTLIIPYKDAQVFLQSLVNALIEQGIRPNNDKTAGELDATKKHLTDLQSYINQLLVIINNANNRIDKN